MMDKYSERREQKQQTGWIDFAEPHLILYKYTKNLRNNGRMRVKFDKWLVHILFLCYLTILLNLAEGAEYGGC